MARSRNIKPGFFKNEDLAECDPYARLLFAGLWTIADREGRLEDRPKRIKAEILPYDSVDVENLLAQLAGHGFIVRYSCEGQHYICIPTFAKNQQPHVHEAASVIPPPEQAESSTVSNKEEYGTSTVQVPYSHPTSPPLTLTSSLNTESLNLEREAAQAPPRALQSVKPPRKTLAAHPLPPDFAITSDMRQKAKAEGLTTWIDIDKHTTRFVEYWTIGEGAGRTKKNWLLTWQNWMRSEAEKAEARGVRLGGNGNGTHQHNGAEIYSAQGRGPNDRSGLRDLLEKRRSEAKGA